MLDLQHRKAYDEQGYLHLRAAFSADEVAVLAEELARICRFAYGPVHGVDAPRPDETDDDLLRKTVAIHFPHKLSPAIRGFVRHPVLVGVLSALLGPNVKCVQSMFFVRPSGGPGQAWHQDEHYIPSRDRSVTSTWIAVDRATAENGCLRVIPGSHRRGILWPHGPHDDPRFDPVGEAHHHPYTEADAVTLEADPGDVIVFNGYLLHRSGRNEARHGFRRSLAFHSVRAESLMPWMGAERRGPIGGADCRDFELVCGEDPYAFAPREDVSPPWMRPAVLPPLEPADEP